MSMDNQNGIILLKKQFLCCTPLNKLKWPNLLNYSDISIQKKIIEETVNNKLVLQYPIKTSYKNGFLKVLINKLELSGIEIDDVVYNTYCDSIASPDGQESMHFRHFLLSDQSFNHTLSIKESTNIISQGTTGLFCWKAGFHLAEWCMVNKEEIYEKNILELGSGVGLTGLTIINYCAPKKYYFSDCHPIVLKTLEENVHLNLLNKEDGFLWKEILSADRVQFEKTDKEDMKVEIINLRWEDIGKLNFEDIHLDLVIAADVLYDKSAFKALATGIQILLNKTVKFAIIAVTVRNELTLDEFLNLLGEYDLTYKEESVPESRIFVQSEETEVKILKISKIRIN